MTPVIFYEYSNCSTCKKALKFLANNRYAVDKRDIISSPPSKAEIEKMIGFYDGDYKKLFNTTGHVYREMGLGEKLRSLTKSEAIDLLATNGKLIKRPFVLTKDGGLVGFHEATWISVFKK